MIKVNREDTYFLEALNCYKSSDFSEAEKLCIKSLEVNKNHFDSLHLISIIFNHNKDYEKALLHIEKALKINQSVESAYLNYANILRNLNYLDKSLEAYKVAIKINKNYAEAYCNQSIVLLKLNKVNEALNSCEKSIELKPKLAEAYLNYGIILKEKKSYEKALNALDYAISIKQNFPEAYCNKGIILKDLGCLDKALDNYNKALHLRSDYVEVYFNIANVLQNYNRLKDAFIYYEKIYKLNPNFEFILGTMLFSRNGICDWTDYNLNTEKLKNLIEDGKRVTPSFHILSIFDSLKLIKKTSEIWVESKLKSIKSLGPYKKNNHKIAKKIKVGYYSSDLHNHATAYLIAELLESHDLNKFEIFIFSFGPDKNDAMRERINSGINNFINLNGVSDLEVAKLSRDKCIDIAIDLKGYTQDSRSAIFFYGCAPVQVNYLGYPGTMGTNVIDYIIADKIVAPEINSDYYSEKIIYMPNCYQVNDSKRKISKGNVSKSSENIPENSFVFACFNNNYKITPEVFDSWMRIIKSIDGSILWLLGDNESAIKNLKKEAIARGVNSERLVFAKRIPIEDHLARHEFADLFLDTFPYNAHTTASDALWAGLPVLTMVGESFASRVAASLLSALEMPELITNSRNEYESLALELATNTQRLRNIKKILEIKRKTSPLFDGTKFAKNLENAYTQIYERYQTSLPPDHIEVKPYVEILQMNNLQNKVFEFLHLNDLIQVMDIGASAINENPVYKNLLVSNWANLHAFEGDDRQINKIKESYGKNAQIWQDFLFDGTEKTLYVASGPSGMTSLFKPKEDALQFFNGFKEFGKVEKTEQVQTKRLDSISDLPSLDFIKLDIQGAELTVLQNGIQKIKNCVAIQLEVSYINLYEQQPAFGEVDTWMRSQGFVPHCFLEVKRWSIAPTIFNNNFRVPGNQLLESDIVYIKDPLKLELLNTDQIKKLITIAHHCFKSYDLCVYLFLELSKRNQAPLNVQQLYLTELTKKA